MGGVCNLSKNLTENYDLDQMSDRNTFSNL